MDGIACALSKKCRKEKSKEIVKSIDKEQTAYEKIYGVDEDNYDK